MFDKRPLRASVVGIIVLMNCHKLFDDDPLRSVWYMWLKIENCCLKIFVKIRVCEKVCENM